MSVLIPPLSQRRTEYEPCETTEHKWPEPTLMPVLYPLATGQL